MLRVEQRARATLGRQLGGEAMSILAAFGLAGLVLVFAGVPPLEAYAEMIVESLGSGYGISETLTKATPLILCGLGVSLAFRMRLWNIGAEGQLHMGAIGATWVALFSGLQSSWLLLPGMLVAGGLCGGLWAAVPGWLKARWNVNEIILTLLLNYVALALLAFLVYGPWKDPQGFNFPLTAQFPQEARLESWFNTRLHTGFAIALGLVALMTLLLERTPWGYEVRVMGDNPEAARYAGMPTGRMIVLVLGLSGAFAGVAGCVEVAGLQYRLQEGISPGYGFTAIIVAWLARRSALGVLLVSVVMGAVFVGSESLQISWQLPMAFVSLFQGLILMSLLASDFLLRYRVRWIRAEVNG